MPRLTVSMPARNTERFVADAIESVLRQTFTDFELVVVDDASTDRTAEVVAGFGDARVRVIRNLVRQGIAACHNTVLRVADSELMVHVDSDDVVLPNGFQRMVSVMEDHPAAPGAHCHFAFIDDRGQPAWNRFTRARMARQRGRGPTPDYRRDLVVHGGECANHLRTYRTALLRDFGGFDESLAWSEDLEMALRLVDRAPLVLVPEVLYLKRIHPGAASEALRLQGLRFLWDRSRLAWRLWQSGRIRYPDRAPYYLPRLVAAGLLETMKQTAANVLPERRRSAAEGPDT